MLGYASYIVEDPKYYNIPSTKIATTLGVVSAYCEILVIPFHVFIGLMYDLVGRRIILFVGLLLLSAGIGFVPLSHSIYPWYFIYRLLTSFGLTMTMGTPLLADYTQKEFLGRAQSINEVVGHVAMLVSTSGLLSLASNLPDEGVIYYWTGGSIAVATFILIFGIKDVDTKEQAEAELPHFGGEIDNEVDLSLGEIKQEDVPKKTLCSILSTVWKEIKTKPDYWVIFLM